MQRRIQGGGGQKGQLIAPPPPFYQNLIRQAILMHVSISLARARPLEKGSGKNAIPKLCSKFLQDLITLTSSA